MLSFRRLSQEIISSSLTDLTEITMLLWKKYLLTTFLFIFTAKNLFAGMSPGKIEEKVVPDLVAIKGAHPSEMLKIGMKNIGGMERFIKPGQTVLIKPNLVLDAPEFSGVDTNAELVGAIVKMAYEAGAKKVTVFDHNLYNFEENKIRVNSGIKKAVKDNGGSLLFGSNISDYIKVKIPSSKILEGVLVHNLYINTDVIINVPVLKSHNITIMSGALKNLMGVVWDRSVWHFRGIHECISDFPLFRKPDLNILDAYVALMKNGPRGFSIHDLELKKTLIISKDMLLVDAAGAKLLKMDVNSILYLKLAEKKGIGSLDLDRHIIKRIDCDNNVCKEI